MIEKIVQVRISLAAFSLKVAFTSVDVTAAATASYMLVASDESAKLF